MIRNGGIVKSCESCEEPEKRENQQHDVSRRIKKDLDEKIQEIMLKIAHICPF